MNNELYYRGNEGILARCLSLVNVKGELHLVHELSSGNNDVSLNSEYRGGYYWPNIAKDAFNIQKSCLQC